MYCSKYFQFWQPEYFLLLSRTSIFGTRWKFPASKIIKSWLSHDDSWIIMPFISHIFNTWTNNGRMNEKQTTLECWIEIHVCINCNLNSYTKLIIQYTLLNQHLLLRLRSSDTWTLWRFFTERLSTTWSCFAPSWTEIRLIVFRRCDITACSTEFMIWSSYIRYGFSRVASQGIQRMLHIIRSIHCYLFSIRLSLYKECMNETTTM